MFKLHTFPQGVGLPALMSEYFNVEKKARVHRRQLMRKVRALRDEGKSCDIIKTCVSLARQMGRIERHATYMGRSATCQYHRIAYEFHWAHYKNYRRD